MPIKERLFALANHEHAPVAAFLISGGVAGLAGALLGLPVIATLTAAALCATAAHWGVSQYQELEDDAGLDGGKLVAIPAGMALGFYGGPALAHEVFPDVSGYPVLAMLGVSAIAGAAFGAVGGYFGTHAMQHFARGLGESTVLAAKAVSSPFRSLRNL